MKRFGLFMMLLFLWQPGFSKNLVLVEFTTNSYDSTLSWLSDMEAIGVTPRHVFPPNLAIVEAFGLPKEYLGTGSERWTVHSTGDMMGDPMLLKSHPAIYLFNWRLIFATGFSHTQE